VGHLGWELLLDGALLGQSHAAEAFDEALAVAPPSAEVFAHGDGERWLVLVEHLATSRWWLRYDDPEVVAETLRRRVDDRPRLPFQPDSMPTVARIFAAAQGSVNAASGAVIDRVVLGAVGPLGAARQVNR
jgi:hypothetical protein